MRINYIAVLVIMLLPPSDLILYNTGCRVHGKTVSEKLMARPRGPLCLIHLCTNYAFMASFLTLCLFNFVHFHLSFLSLRFLAYAPTSLFS